MNIDWSMVGAIAGIIAVLVVVIIEADRLLPRLVYICLFLGVITLPVGFLTFGIGSMSALFFPSFVTKHLSVYDVMAIIAGYSSVIGVVSISLFATYFYFSEEFEEFNLTNALIGLSVAVLSSWVLYNLISGSWTLSAASLFM